MYRHFGRGWLRAVTSFRLVALWVRPEGESVTDNILSVTLILYIIHIRVRHLIHIPRDILLPVYMYLLYLLDGTVEAWMKSLVFIHLTQLPSNPIIFGFGRLALRCDFSKTKIQPLTSINRKLCTKPATTTTPPLKWLSLHTLAESETRTAPLRFVVTPPVHIRMGTSPPIVGRKVD